MCEMAAGKHARSIQPPKRRDPRKVSRVRAPQWTNLPAIGPERLSALRADVQTARDEYRLSHPEHAERALLRPLRALQAAIALGPPADEHATHLLYANAWTVLGRSRRKLGHPRQAQAAFEQAASTFGRLLGERCVTGDPMDWADYGMALEHLERFDEAVAALDVAIDRGLRTPDVFRHMGFALRDREPDKAQACFEEVLRLTPDDPYAIRVLAEHIERRHPGGAAELLRQAAFGYAFHGEVDDALALFERALKATPDDPDLLAGRAEMLRLLDRCSAAVETFDRSLAIRPDMPWVLAGKAAALHRMSHNREALELLEDTLRIAPDFVFASGTKGRVLRALGDLEASAETLRAVPSNDPSSAWILADLGETLRLMGRDDEALEALNGALDLMPRDAAATATRAAIRLTQGDHDRAMRDVKRALQLDPDSAFAYTVRGQIEYVLEDYDAAVRSFRRAVELDRWQAEYFSMLGEALRVANRAEEALEELDRAIHLAPTYAPAWVRRATALSDLRHFDDALAAVDHALELSGGDYPHALAERARILRDRDQPGDREAARESFHRSLELDPQQPVTRVELALLLTEAGDPQGARAHSDAALADDPHLVDALVLRGRSNRMLGAINDAIDDLRRAAELDPADAWHLAELGDALLEVGDGQAALDALDAALARSPNLWFALATKGQALRLMGEPQGAVAALRQAQEHLDEPWVEIELGEALRLSDRPAEALECFERALSADPDNRWALSGRGSAQHALQRYEEALQSFDRALRLDASNDFARVSMASVLIEIGRYGQARELLDQVGPKVDPSWVLALRGWACELSGDGAAAYEAFTEHLKIEPGSLWSQRGVAEALLQQQRDDAARAAYAEIVASRGGTAVSPADMEPIGWSYLRLGQLDADRREELLAAAAQYLSGGLTTSRDVVSLQCDLGLALVCAGRLRHGSAAYDRALAAARQQLDPLRRHAVLAIAVDDLETSSRLLPEVSAEEAWGAVSAKLVGAMEEAARDAARRQAEHAAEIQRQAEREASALAP
jgi:tetratricopeptide (TPR) repeat protein